MKFGPHTEIIMVAMETILVFWKKSLLLLFCPEGKVVELEDLQCCAQYDL